MDRAPSLFVSHGAPDLLLQPVPAHRFLAGLGRELGALRAVLCLSAHWLTPEPRVETSARPQTIHDFSGFDPALARFEYPAPGDPELAAEAVAALAEAGIASRGVERGLDHGAWVPLALMWPDARMPVVQLSLQLELGPAHALRVGRALAPLRERGVLVLGSGSATHDLRRIAPGDRAPDWVRLFDDWLVARVEAGDVEALVEYRAQAPHAADNHPIEDHYLPLVAAAGAAGASVRGRTLHRSTTYGVLAMTAFRWD